MAYIKKIRFDKVGKTEGCTCDRCGQYIQNIWTVTYTDDVVMHFGIDCFKKLNKGKLNSYGMKVMRKALKDIEYYSEELKKWENGYYTEECVEWQNLQVKHEWESQVSYWYGRQFEEYKEWMINEFFPARMREVQKEIDRFKKVNFER